MRLKVALLIIIMALLLPHLVLAQGIVVTATTNLRIRAQPTVSAPSLQVAPRGTTMVALGRNADTTWIQVEYKGVIGWATVVYLAASDPLTNLPITDATDPTVDPRPQEQVSAPDGTTVLSGQLIVFSTSSNVNVRVLPDEGSPVIGQLAQNERATVTLLDTTLTWGRIEFQGQFGWVALYVVTVLGDIRTVEVLGDPGSGAEMPLAGDGSHNLEQRQIVQNAQNHLARYLPHISGLLDILRAGASNGIIACGPVPDLLRAYNPLRTDYARVPELEALVNTMNQAFNTINRARAQWLSACSTGQTLLFRDRFVQWRDLAESALPAIDEVQRGFAELAAR